jgi:hypothetical protein
MSFWVGLKNSIDPPALGHPASIEARGQSRPVMMSGRQAVGPENQEGYASSRNSLKQRVDLQPYKYACQRVPRFVQMGGPRFPDWPMNDLPFLPVELVAL